MKLTLSFLALLGAFFMTPAQAAECGTASFYHNYYEGRTTSSGTTFRQNSSQAAHPYARFGTKFRVRASNGNSTVVTITDRGPFTGGRIIDLSKSSFANLTSLSRGLVSVCLQRI